MAEINKLSVGQALDKLRGTDAASSQTNLDGKIAELDEEILRLRATSRRIERDQRAASTAPATPEVNAGRVPRTVLFGVMGGIFLAILVVAGIWALS